MKTLKKVALWEKISSWQNRELEQGVKKLRWRKIMKNHVLNDTETERRLVGPISKGLEGEKGERTWAKWGVTAKGYEVSFGDE